jgi:DNA-binding CsgD family transcriptional regulator
VPTVTVRVDPELGAPAPALWAAFDFALEAVTGTASPAVGAGDGLEGIARLVAAAQAAQDRWRGLAALLRQTETELRHDPERLRAGLDKLERRCVVDGLVRRGDLRAVFGYEVERDVFHHPELEPATDAAQTAFVTQLTACIVSTLLLRALRATRSPGPATAGSSAPSHDHEAAVRRGRRLPRRSRTPDALSRVTEALRAAPAEGLGALMRLSPDQAQRERALAELTGLVTATLGIFGEHGSARLRGALREDGRHPRDVLLEEALGAVYDAWHGHSREGLGRVVNAVEIALVGGGRPRDEYGADRWRLGDDALAAAQPPPTAGDPPELEQVALRAELRRLMDQAGLSPREALVWTLGGLGHTRRQIAAALGTAPGTVASHKARAKRKLKSYARLEELLRRAGLPAPAALEAGHVRRSSRPQRLGRTGRTRRQGRKRDSETTLDR